jgi:hypothetical protein
MFLSAALPEDDRLTALDAMLVKRNHQSAKQHAPTLKQMMLAEIGHGW